MSDSSDAENDAVEKAFRSIINVQDVIDFTETHLLGLRTECAPNAEVTQNEIRTQEAKLIKLFSKQLVEKERVAKEDIDNRLGQYPKTDQWLKVVGLNDGIIQGIIQDGINMSTLLEMSDEIVRRLLQRWNSAENDIIKLILALNNLNLWTERQLHGDNNINDSDLELHWTRSFNQSGNVSSGNSPKNPPTGRSSTSSLPETTQPLPLPSAPKSNPSSPTPVHAEGKYRHTPPPTPLVQSRGGASSRTPPANRFRKPPAHISLFPEYPSPMIRSHSTEINLPIKVTNVDGINWKAKGNTEMRLTNDISHVIRRPSNDDNIGLSGHTSPVLPSPSYNNGDTNLVVPKSPKPIHKLSNTFKITTCNVCHKQMFIGMKCKVCKFKNGYIMSVLCDVCHKHIYIMGKICKLCKFKCHRECASKASNTCQPDRDSSPSPVPLDKNLKLNPISVSDFRNDSGSNPSSCNSSTPSSPIVMHTPSPGTGEAFVYPELGGISDADGEVFINKESVSSKDDRDFVSTNTSDDSNKTLVDSNTSEKTLEREDSVDSQDGLGHRWDRGHSLSITLKEWDIPFEQLKIEDPIGTGRFGTVYKGTWHGQVAIKMLHMDSDTDNQAQISAFKLEVAMLKNTRHENLLLFMGACMKPPQLAIVTSYCSGQTLYAYVRTSREKFQMHKTILIAQQIAQGMGYLHAKGIVHKDLKTKNIFLENGKIVITDFGLFNVTKLCHGNRKGDWLHISPGWLCYLSPEVIKCLSAGRSKQDLPFSEKSDIYAFGTIWYELLVGDWPFRNQPTECIIWQVGRGMKQSLGSVTAPREVKDILMMCWSYTCDDRPQFKQLLKAMDKLPKKRLVRSPSHPVQMSRSMDSVYTA